LENFHVVLPWRPRSLPPDECVHALPPCTHVGNDNLPWSFGPPWLAARPLLLWHIPSQHAVLGTYSSRPTRPLSHPTSILTQSRSARCSIWHYPNETEAPPLRPRRTTTVEPLGDWMEGYCTSLDRRTLSRASLVSTRTHSISAKAAG